MADADAPEFAIPVTDTGAHDTGAGHSSPHSGLTCNHAAAPHTATGTDLTVAITSDPPDNGTVVVASLPYVVTYTVTLSNIGTTDAPAFALLEEQYNDFYTTDTDVPIAGLAAGAAQTFPIPVSYTAPSINSNGLRGAGLYVYADDLCQVNDGNRDNNSADHAFSLTTTGVNLGAGNNGVLPSTTHVGEGDLTVGESGSPFFTIRNYGTTTPTTDVVVTLSTVTKPITVKTTDLPAPGISKSFRLKTPRVGFKKAGDAPSVLTTNAPHQGVNPDPKATNKEINVAERVITVAPKGIDLSVFGGTNACPALVNTPTAFLFYVVNGGTQKTGPFTLQVYVDGGALGAPIAFKGLKTTADKKGSFFLPVKISLTVATTGAHVFKVMIDPLKNKDYNSTNNSIEGTFYLV